MALAEHAATLADAMADALPRWVARVAPGVDAAPVTDAVMAAVRDLLALDVDVQRTTPLAIVRDVAVPLLTAELRARGAAPAARDDFAAERFPDDVYGLTPASWADLDDSVVEAGIAWGAAKAFVHKQRRSA